MQGNKNKLPNHLWITRKRRGLQQKHVAYLLNHRTTHQISRCEKGHRIPGLRLLLQLEIVYGLSARLLYPDFFEELRSEIEQRSHKIKGVNGTLALPPAEADTTGHQCHFAGLLSELNPTPEERIQARDHVLALMRRINELL
ncbi:MAG TPA: helix-turn-helix transcriptional regulator [Blastocatellia bacterium]|nr:helix-turn-helix transcriptional regulator [Blastocatellia bacterium]